MLPEDKRIRTKEDLNRVLRHEYKRYGKKMGILLPFIENDILVKHNVLLRKTEYYINSGHKILGSIYKTRLYRLQNKYSIHVGVNCCEEGLHIMHVGPVLMNPNVQVGKNCSIHINTGLVASGHGSEAPIIGDNVVIGFGAVVLGGVKVANNVAIGANAVVNKDVLEPNIAVAGVPAKAISHNGTSTWH